MHPHLLFTKGVWSGIGCRGRRPAAAAGAALRARHSLRPRCHCLQYLPRLLQCAAEKYSLAQQRNTAWQNRETQCASVLQRAVQYSVHYWSAPRRRFAAWHSWGLCGSARLPACLLAVSTTGRPRPQTSRLHLVAMSRLEAALNAVFPVHHWFSQVLRNFVNVSAVFFLLFDIEGLLYLWPVVQRFSFKWKCVQKIL